MSPLTAWKKGASQIWFHKRLLIGLYVVNVLFAAVLIYPFREIVAKLARTDLSDGFVSGFRLDWFTFFWSEYGTALKSLGFAALALGALYLLFYVFLTGGIVATLLADEKTSLRRFFYVSGRYFYRFFRLFLLLAGTVALVVVTYKYALADWLETAREEATTGRTQFLYRCLSAAVLAAVFSLVAMVFDYAKIRTVHDSRRSMCLTVLASAWFSLRRCYGAVPLFYLNLILIGVLFVVYLLVAALFSGASLASVLALFVVQQLLIVGRIWMKLSFFASQAVYYQSTRAVPRPQEPLPSPEPTPTETPEPPPVDEAIATT